MVNGDQHGMRHSNICPFAPTSGTEFILSTKIKITSALFTSIKMIKLFDRAEIQKLNIVYLQVASAPKICPKPNSADEIITAYNVALSRLPNHFSMIFCNNPLRWAVYVKTRNLWIPIILHFVVDLCGIPFCFIKFPLISSSLRLILLSIISDTSFFLCCVDSF